MSLVIVEHAPGMSMERMLSASAVLVSGLAWLVLGRLAAGAGSLQGQRLGLRGLKRQRALRTSLLWSKLEPLVRWLAARSAGWVSLALRVRLDRQLVQSGDILGLLPEEAVGLSILSGLVGALLGAALGALTGLGSLVALATTVIGVLAPSLHIQARAAERMKEIERRLPHAIDLLALAMGAGLDFPGSVQRLVQKSASPDDPVIEEFTLILQSLQLGRSRRQALEQFAARVPTDAVLEFVGAMVQAESRGNPVAEVLRIQSEVSRRQRSVRAEESAAQAGVAMMGPLVLMFLGILVLIVAPTLMRLSNSGP